MKRISKTLSTAMLFTLVCLHSGWAETRSEWRNGILVFFDSLTFETLDAMAPRKIFEEFQQVHNANHIIARATTGIATQTHSAFSLSVVNSGSAHYRTFAGHEDWDALAISTGAADDDDAELTSGLVWYATNYPVIEARLRLDGATATISMNVGFSDSISEAKTQLAFGYSGTILTATASNAILFFSDSDGTTDLFRAGSVIGGVTGTVFETSEPTDMDYHIYRIEINGDGDVDFWFDGNHLGNESLAVATTVPLTPYIGLINRTGSSRTLAIDYIRVWGRR